MAINAVMVTGIATGVWTGITSGERWTKATLAVPKRPHEGEAGYTKAT